MSENLKILVLNYEYPPIGGGGGVISKYIAEGLANKGNKITIVTTWIKGLEEQSESRNIKIIRLKSKRKNNFRSNPSEMLSWIKYSKAFLSEYCTKEKFDICIANFAIPGGNVAKFLKRKSNVPYLIISHGHDIPWVKPCSLYFFHFVNYFKIKSICEESSAICVQSSQMKSNLERFIGSSLKNILIPNGYDTSIFYPDYTKRPENLKILFTGRLVKQKEPLTFLNAVNILSKSGIKFSATMLGDGPLRNKVENYISKNNLSDIVNIRGKIPYVEIAAELQSSHIFVSTSVSEGMSISLIEAIACGNYIITTATSGTKELVLSGRNGEFVDYNAPKQLATTILNFHKTNFLKNYTTDSDFFDSFKNKFSWKNIIENYDELIKNLITEN